MLSSSLTWLTPKVFANSSPGLRFGNPGIREAHRFLCNPEGVAWPFEIEPRRNPFRVAPKMWNVGIPGLRFGNPGVLEALRILCNPEGVAWPFEIEPRRNPFRVAPTKNVERWGPRVALWQPWGTNTTHSFLATLKGLRWFGLANDPQPFQGWSSTKTSPCYPGLPKRNPGLKFANTFGVGLSNTKTGIHLRPPLKPSNPGATSCIHMPPQFALPWSLSYSF